MPHMPLFELVLLYKKPLRYMKEMFLRNVLKTRDAKPYTLLPHSTPVRCQRGLPQ